MDKLVFTVMSGAERLLHAQRVRANNLANADTPGFRADYELASSQAVAGSGFDSRHLSRVEVDMVSLREGAVRETGRELDIAIEGQGYIAVGHGETEGYTRAGALSLDVEGRLTVQGRPVLGDGGPIVLPEFTRIAIAADGTISVQERGADEMQVLDRIKLVRAEGVRLQKNEAGLLVTAGGQALEADDTVRVRSGALEGSNVRAVEEMVAVMDISRQFEIQMKLYSAADSMADAGNRLIRE